MSGPTEDAVVRACVAELDKRGAYHFNVGAGNGETGLPDRVAVYRGRAILLEFKRPHGGRLSEKQKWHREKATAAGGVVMVLQSVKPLRGLLDSIDRRARQGAA